ncbi:hypothetical protein [Brucella pituitosa]|uniref:hypothetical protein n=1 Tax=Brucella pituitosa TaxID=571256 RepID=UPI001FFF88A2|nr:hypothetical protein [Brucella pituitosa]
MLPSLVALLLGGLAWRPVLGLMALLEIALTFTLARLVPPVSVATENKEQATISRRRSGFRILTVIGGFDTATRMGYLRCLPFLV